MEEKIFFEYGDVKVTNARFINGSQTYAMSNITSVKASEEKAKRFWPIVLLLIGLVTLVSALGEGTPALGIGIILVAGSLIALFTRKKQYFVKLSTSAGETNALKTNQREYLDKVVGALNEAIVHRG